MFIVATIGHTSLSEDKVRKIVLADADILRYNFSYRVVKENVEHIRTAERIIEELNSSVKILIDMPVDKIRLGDFDTKTFAVRENEELTFKSAPYSPDCNQFIPIEMSRLGDKTYVNQIITIGDGEVSFEVKEIINNDTIKARVLNNGILHYMKTFNCGHTNTEEAVLNTYKKDLDLVQNISPHFVAISYIEKDTNERIKQLIDSYNLGAKIIIKIERELSEYELEMICLDPYYGMILIDRGEIGVNIPYEKLGVYQKQIMAIARKFKKPTIVSTQILESTINNFIPSRSDILDLTNIVLDGADGIMLCMETAANQRPIYSLSVARKIIVEAEKHRRVREEINHQHTPKNTL